MVIELVRGVYLWKKEQRSELIESGFILVETFLIFLWTLVSLYYYYSYCFDDEVVLMYNNL